MDEPVKSEVEPKKRRRSRLAVVAPPVAEKKRRAPRQPQGDKEIRAEMKRLGYAVNKDNIEMFKLATYQVVQAKLSEVAQLLRLVAPNGANTYYAPAVQPSPPAARPMTVENIDRVVQRLDNGAALQQATGPKCQICGQTAVAKNNRGMTVCAGHRGLIQGDEAADALTRRLLAKGFGNPNEEVIKVAAQTIQRAMANDQSGE